MILGDRADGTRLQLSRDERLTHMHVIGSSGSGKSKFMEWMIRQDLANHQGFCLIDPHGTLYNDVLNYCAFKVLRRNIVLLDLSCPREIVPFNPFKANVDGEVAVRVDRRIAATMHAWDAPNTDETPTLERILRLVFTVLIENGLSFHHAQFLIDFNSRSIREYLITKLSSGLIKREWQELQHLKAQDWRWEVLSAKNRLFRLLTSKTLARFLNGSSPGLDIAEIVNSGKVLLVNLAPSDHLSAENARVFGALLVNEFFEVARRRRGSEISLKPFYLYLDEFQTFVSLDITKMLDQVRKFKLFTVLAHQRFGQLEPETSDAVLTNCRIKAIFGGLPVESARAMAQEMFIGQLDPQRIKVAIYQTKFWPKYSRDTIYTTSTSTGFSTGKGQNRAVGIGHNQLSGEFFNPADWFSQGQLVGQSLTSSYATNEALGMHSSETEFQGNAYGEADVPIMLPVPFQELSSVQFFTPEEQLNELTAALKEQFGRHCFIKIHDQTTQPMAVPFVMEHKPVSEVLTRYKQGLFASAKASTAQEVDERIAKEEQAMNRLAVGQKSTNAPKEPWADFFGKE